MNSIDHIKIIIRKVSLLLISAILSVSLSSCAHTAGKQSYGPQDDKKLVIYTAHKEEIYMPIIREFEERTGIWVDVVSGSTNHILEQIASENGNNSGDIMFGGGVDSLSAYEEYFEPYRVSSYDKLDKTYSSATDSYTVFSKLPIVFIYNTKLVLPAAAPRTWEQLPGYNWVGRIAFADPASSGSSYTALLIFISKLKKEDASEEIIIKEFIDSLNGELSEGSDKVTEDVASGRKLIGITLAENAYKEMAKSSDIGIIFPSDGTCALPDGCAIIKNAPHKQNAELFMEFMVSEDVQRLLEDQLYRNSVRTDIAVKDIPNENKYNIRYSLDNRDRILDIWNRLLEDEKSEKYE